MNKLQIYRLSNYLLNHLIFFGLVGLQITAQVVMKESDILETYSPGAYFEEHDVDLYDSVVPLLFKFKKPEWMELTKLKLPIECSKDTVAAGPLCPIFFYLNKRLSEELRTVGQLPFSFPETNMNITFECDKLSQHFLTERINNNRFNEYRILLRKCANGNLWESDLMSKYSFILQAAYDNMITKFNVYYHNASKLSSPEAERTLTAAELNDQTALSGLLNMHYLSLVKRWRRGTRDCKRGFIPDSLISEHDLRKGLIATERNISSGNPKYRYTMPYELGQITRYYSAPIADCVYSSDTFFVRILVPITKVRKTPVKLINIRAIPFYVASDDGIPQLCMVQGFSKGRMFHTGLEELGTTGKIGSLSSPVTCDSTNFKLCKIPDPNESFVNPVTECARKLIEYDNEPSNENDAAISLKCGMECSEIKKPESLPFVVRAKDPFETIYLVTNADKKTGIDLECFNDNANGTGKSEDNTYMVSVPSIKKGALGIILSCNCRIGLPWVNVLASETCADTLLVFKVISFQLAAGNPGSSNGKEPVNTPSPVSPEDAA